MNLFVTKLILFFMKNQSNSDCDIIRLVTAGNKVKFAPTS